MNDSIKEKDAPNFVAITGADSNGLHALGSDGHIYRLFYEKPVTPGAEPVTYWQKVKGKVREGN